MSFPSGHTTGAAFAASFIAIVSNSRAWAIFLAFFAIIVGISRVYLAQHFVIDIYFGYLFGFISSLLGFCLIYNRYFNFIVFNNKYLAFESILKKMKRYSLRQIVSIKIYVKNYQHANILK